MPSRTSCFNAALYRKLLSRFWPMWVGVTALACLAPLLVLLNQLQPYAGSISVSMAQYAYYMLLTIPAPAFMMGYALLCAMAVWGYLYQSRSVSLMHTLPVTRTALFVTGCCAGFTFMLLPMAVAGVLLFLVMSAFGGIAPAAFLQCAGGLVLLALLNFGVATLCAMVTGHLLALPVFYLLLNFLAVILDFLLCTFTNSFLFGVSTSYSGAVEWLSPLIYLYQKLGVTEIRQSLPEGGSQLIGYRFEGMPVLLAYGLVGALLLVAAWLLYRRRASESAGDVVAFRTLRPLFKLGLGVFAALSAGQLLCAVLAQVLGGSSLLLMGVCMVIAGTIGFWIADMLVQKSLRVLKTTAVGAGVMAVLALVVCLAVRFDLFGVEKQIPEKGEIVSVEFYLAGVNNFTLTSAANPDAIDLVLDAHRKIVEAKAEIQAAESSRADYYFPDYLGPQEDGFVWRTFRLIYRLKNGDTLQRNYYLPISRALLEDQDSYAAALERLVNDQEVQLTRVLYDTIYTPYYTTVYTYRENVENNAVSLETADSQRLYEALLEDVKAGRWGRYDLMEDGNTKETWLEFSMDFQGNRFSDDSGENMDYTVYDSIYIIYTPSMTSTAQALVELGIDPTWLEPPVYDENGLPMTVDISV